MGRAPVGRVLKGMLLRIDSLKGPGVLSTQSERTVWEGGMWTPGRLPSPANRDRKGSRVAAGASSRFQPEPITVRGKMTAYFGHFGVEDDQRTDSCDRRSL